MDTFSQNTINSRLALLSMCSDAPVSPAERAAVVLEQVHRQLATIAPHVKTHLVTFQSDGLPDFVDVINLVVGALEKSGFACTGNDGKGKFGGVSMSGLWGIRVIRTPGIQAAKAEKDPRHHYSLLWPGSDLMDELTACTVYTPDPLYTPDGLITRAAACIQKIISHIRSQGALEKFIFADIEPDGHEMFSDVTLLVTRMLADAEFACVEACHADGTYSIITPKGDGECKRVKLTRVSK